MQLISIEKDAATGKDVFHVNQDALKTLTALDGPFGVFSMCGAFKSGKSFLLNQLLQKGRGQRVSYKSRRLTSVLSFSSTFGESFRPATKGPAATKPSSRRRRKKGRRASGSGASPSGCQTGEFT